MANTDRQILDFLGLRLAAHEGGAPQVVVCYDDATGDYIVAQANETLGCSRSITRARKSIIRQPWYARLVWTRQGGTDAFWWRVLALCGAMVAVEALMIFGIVEAGLWLMRWLGGAR